ncbi:gamma-glutamylcyclotransferase [Enterovirga sp. CN4-39]|uniref:gamma-glutamylcyclotransferase n=1 Tax=Enterovirga sp. CN4-39 TaxID=3400910 RepID=UPI003BFD9DF5
MSDGEPRTGREGFVITRDRLRDGSHLAAIRARATPDFHVRSDEDIERSLEETLARHRATEDVWVFGYGSLMWNPAFHFEERRLGIVRGWHRRFCLWLSRGRGSPDCPGLMLALDRGGVCRGVAFRVPAAQARDELLLVWRREMLSGAYLARWVTVATDEGAVPAVTFVVNQAHQRYSGKLGEAETADRILTASGELGSCLDYFERTVRILRTLKVRDAALERIEAEIARRNGGPG